MTLAFGPAAIVIWQIEMQIDQASYIRRSIAGHPITLERDLVDSEVRGWVAKWGAHMGTYGTDGDLDRIVITSDDHDLPGKAVAAFEASGIDLEFISTEK